MPVTSKKESSHMDINYLAGFFDGEGYVGIIRTVRKDRKLDNGEDSTSYQVVATVAQSNCNILREYQSRWGGWINMGWKNPKQTKQVYTWRVTGDGVRAFLKDISPFLVEKREQALLAIQLPSANVGGRWVDRSAKI